MGAIAAIGGIASAVIGARSAKKAAATQAASTERAAQIQADAMNRATEASQQGFRYLRDNPLNQQAQAYGGQAMGMRNALLGIGDGSGGGGFDQQAAQDAFQNYQQSTGYQFRLNEGMGAINQNAAASGLMNSGATAKALTQYGQNISSAEFGNYLNYLGGTEQTGLQAAANVASQGQASGQAAAGALTAGAAGQANVIAQGGVNQANLQLQRGQNIASGIGMAVSGLQDMYMSRR